MKLSNVITVVETYTEVEPMKMVYRVFQPSAVKNIREKYNYVEKI